MSQLAREFPEEYAHIAALPPSQQNEAERELASRAMAQTPFEVVHRTIDEPPPVTKHCRNCGDKFKVPADRSGSGSKWYSLCWSCLRDEM